MYFLPPTRRQSGISILIIGGMLLLLFVLPGNFLKPVQVTLATVTLPFQNLFSWAAFEMREWGDFWGSIQKLKEENELLHQEVVTLRAIQADQKNLEEENIYLRQELDLVQKTRYTLVPAEVIARDRSDASSALWINRGEQQGIQTGMPVVAYGKILIGRINTVAPFSSEVRLLSHPESLVASKVEGSKTESIVRGDHGTGLLLDLARPNEQVKNGATVVTAGMSDGLPEGLFIGTIDTLKLSGDQLFQQASILPPVRADTLRFMSVIIK